MITTSMTASELFEEIKDDYPNVFAISDAKDAKVSRIVKNQAYSRSTSTRLSLPKEKTSGLSYGNRIVRRI